ncbi:MAG: hypothetical protein Kow0060_22210 [Methylohalobius crimeensis]
MTTQNYRAIKFGFLLAALSLVTQGALAHTRLDNPVVQESTSAHGTYDSAVVIPHGCDGNSVIGNVFVMPDQTDSIVQTSTDGFETFETSGQTAADFVAAGGFIRLIKSNDVFAKAGLISDAVGNPVGFWAADGELPASNWVGKLPLRISSVDIQDESCANSVTFVPAIANVCQLSSIEAFGDGVVDLWTAPDAGSPFDAPDWSYPATFKVERDLENSPLPDSCGNGFDVRIFPSAAQLNRDMPVKMNGQQVWPQP